MYGYIYGVVRDSVTKEPIPDALITANGISTTTDERGYYELRVFTRPYRPTWYEVTASKDGYEPASRTVEVMEGKRVECNFELRPVAPPPPTPPVPWWEELMKYAPYIGACIVLVGIAGLIVYGVTRRG